VSSIASSGGRSGCNAEINTGWFPRPHSSGEGRPTGCRRRRGPDWLASPRCGAWRATFGGATTRRGIFYFVLTRWRKTTGRSISRYEASSARNWSSTFSAVSNTARRRDRADPRSDAHFVPYRRSVRRSSDLRRCRLVPGSGAMEYARKPAHLFERALFDGALGKAGPGQRAPAAKPALR
jgi:hypothetical protein